MNSIFVITVQVSQSGGHGEGSSDYKALVDPQRLGYFTTREVAERALENVKGTYYGCWNAEVTELIQIA